MTTTAASSAVALPQGSQGGGMGEPGIKRHSRQGDVVAMLASMGAELDQLDETVGRPVQVGVVEEQGGVDGRRLPADRLGLSAEEVQQWQQGGAAPVAEAFAQRLAGAELGWNHQGALVDAAAAPGRP